MNTCNVVNDTDFQAVQTGDTTTFIAATRDGLDVWFVRAGQLISDKLGVMSSPMIAQFLNALHHGIEEISITALPA